jgi:LytS/YehU family sensor histidine kinase
MINQKIAEFKMTALRSQMNPHFVFNAITSIQHYIIKQDTFKSYNYLAKFSLLIRTILDNSKEEYIALSQEINTLKLYIELEQIRFKQPFTFILDIDEQLEMDTYIPTMLIQPYVENSIWHGLMPKKSDCILEVKILKKETHIFVIIKDNGVGRKHTVKKSNLHESKGMSITEQRIKELETTNEKKFNVSILDLTDETGNATGTEIHIIIPFDL